MALRCKSTISEPQYISLQNNMKKFQVIQFLAINVFYILEIIIGWA